MKLYIELPSKIEGNWTLVDGDGKPICDNTPPGAMIVLEPHFYKGMHSQALLRSTNAGKKGLTVDQTIRVSATTGKLTAESAGKVPKPIEPHFDKKEPKKSAPKEPTNGS